MPCRSGGDGDLNQGEFSNQHQGLSIDVLLLEENPKGQPGPEILVEQKEELEKRPGQENTAQGLSRTGVHVHLSQDCKSCLPATSRSKGQIPRRRDVMDISRVRSTLGQVSGFLLLPGQRRTDVAMVGKFRGCGPSSISGSHLAPPVAHERN